MTSPVTTPMPNAMAKILVQNVEMRAYSSRPVAKLKPSTTAMKDAHPTVNAGSRMCQATTQANWMRDNSTGSKCIAELLCFGDVERATDGALKAVCKGRRRVENKLRS